MSNYKPNPLLDSYNTSLDKTNNIDRNKNQAANIVSNFMSQQPSHHSEDTDFAKIQAIYNNYQTTKNQPNSATQQLNSNPNPEIPALKKQLWLGFNKKNKEAVLPPNQQDLITENSKKTTLIRKKSWENRLLWVLTFCLLCGGVLWYLAIIQPAGLEVIYSTNQSKINNLSSDYANASKDLLVYIKKLDQLANMGASSNCSTQSIVEDETISQTVMNDYLNNKLSPTSTSSKDDNILTYKYFDNNYSNLTLSYSDSLKTLKQNLESISYIPELIKYKNKFIEGCQLLVDKGFNVQTINQYCNELMPQKEAAVRYFGSIEIPANSKLSTSVAKSVQSCNTRPKLGTNGRIAKDSVSIAVWQEQFDLDYDEFLGRRIQTDKILKDIQATGTQFEEEITKIKASNQKEFDRKKLGFPNYYILQPDMKAIAKRLPI